MNIGHIPAPQHPKNPFTNEPFSLCQLIGLLYQCKSFGHTSWAIEAFIHSRYDLATFSLIHSKPLRLQALRATMADQTSWDSIDTLYDFVKSQHGEHGLPFKHQVYQWAIEHGAQTPRIETWRKYCVKWYEIDILVDDIHAKEKCFDVLHVKTKILCSSPLDLVQLYKGRK
jgi:hypothetical protein